MKDNFAFSRVKQKSIIDPIVSHIAASHLALPQIIHLQGQCTIDQYDDVVDAAGELISTFA